MSKEIQLTKNDFLLLMRYNNIEKDGVKINLSFWENLNFWEMKDIIVYMINSFPRDYSDILLPETFKR